MAEVLEPSNTLASAIAARMSVRATAMFLNTVVAVRKPLILLLNVVFIVAASGCKAFILETRGFCFHETVVRFP